MTRYGSHTESRMRENGTYGSMRGRTYPAGASRPTLHPSRSFSVPICETRPGFRGALLIASNEYNTANQLVATRSYAIEQSNNSGGLRLIESFLVCGEAPVNLGLMVFLGCVEIFFQVP